MNKRSIVSSIFGMLLLLFSLCACTNTTANDQNFLKTHQKELQNSIQTQLDPSKKHISTITIDSPSAHGYYDNGGDVGGNYHIDFNAYVNGNNNASMKVELTFPDLAIGPFTFKKPDPYKTPQNFDKYSIDITFSDDAFWNWKRDEDDRIAESESKSEAIRESVEQSSEEVLNRQMLPIMQKWAQIHQKSLLNQFNKFNPFKSQTGKIKAMEVSKISFESSDWNTVYFTITCMNVTGSATISVRGIFPTSEDDLSKADSVISLDSISPISSDHSDSPLAQLFSTRTNGWGSSAAEDNTIDIK